MRRKLQGTMRKNGFYEKNHENQKAFLYYRKITNRSRNKSPNLNASRLALQLSLPEPLNSTVKSRMEM